jgi:hypothetical protein
MKHKFTASYIISEAKRAEGIHWSEFKNSPRWWFIFVAVITMVQSIGIISGDPQMIIIASLLPLTAMALFRGLVVVLYAGVYSLFHYIFDL